jgi:hypothetical protein
MEKDFLENGKFCNPSETLAKKSESCPPNNISVERVFGELDTKIKQAPNCNIITVEELIVSCHLKKISQTMTD